MAGLGISGPRQPRRKLMFCTVPGHDRFAAGPPDGSCRRAPRRVGDEEEAVAVRASGRRLPGAGRNGGRAGAGRGNCRMSAGATSRPRGGRGSCRNSPSGETLVVALHPRVDGGVAARPGTTRRRPDDRWPSPRRRRAASAPPIRRRRPRGSAGCPPRPRRRASSSVDRPGVDQVMTLQGSRRPEPPTSAVRSSRRSPGGRGDGAAPSAPGRGIAAAGPRPVGKRPAIRYSASRSSRVSVQVGTGGPIPAGMGSSPA